MKKISIRLFLKFGLLFILTGPLCSADVRSDIPFTVIPAWQNKYVTEGRDNLDTGGIYSLELSTSWRQVSFGTWIAQGDSESYQEINFFIEYEFAFDSYDAYIIYTRLEFPNENEKDNEFAIGLTYSALANITPSMDYTWSSNADGGFLELSLNYELYLESPQIVVSPYVSQAFDFGYATSDFDGPNNLQFGIEALFYINDHAQLNLHVNHSFAQNDVEQDNMDDITWFGISIIGTI